MIEDKYQQLEKENEQLKILNKKLSNQVGLFVEQLIKNRIDYSWLWKDYVYFINDDFFKSIENKDRREIVYNKIISKNKDDSFKKIYNDMFTLFKNLEDNVGEETIPLKTIVDAIKEKARHEGIPEAYRMLEQIDHILINVEVWRKNRDKLLKFFDELKQPSPININAGHGSIVQITDKGIINNPLLPTDDKDKK